nr:uncharacterized protein LOC113734306 isoform X1 [Coffea arabica]
MALSHLLRPKSVLKIDRYGFPKPIRWFSSQSSDIELGKSSKLKKTFMPREERAVAAESFVKRYMETNQGVFPKASHIQNEVGGSWHTVKAILCNIKDKILRTPVSDNHYVIDASATAEETASSAFVTYHSLVHDHSGSVVNTDQVLQPQDKDVSFGHSTTAAAVDASSALIVEPTASDATNMHKTSGSCELQTTSTVQCTNSGLDIHASQTDASEKVDVRLSMKYNSESMVQPNAVTDNSQLELDSLCIQPKESVSNMSETSDNGHVSSSEKLSHFEHDKMNSTGCHKWQENKTMSCVPSPNSSVEISPKSTLPDNSQKVGSLADIFKKFKDDASVADAKNGKLESKASLSSTLLSHGKDSNSQVDAKNGKLESKASLSSILLSHTKDSNSQLESLFSSDILLPSKSINKCQDFRTNKLVSGGSENQRPEGEMIGSSVTQTVIPNMAESFTGSGNFMGFGGTKRVNNRVSEFITNKKKDISMRTLFEHLEVPARKNDTTRSEIKELVERIKGLAGEPSILRQKDNVSSCKTDENSQKSQLGFQSLASFNNCDKKERKMSSDCHADHRTSKNDDPLMVLPVGSRTQDDAGNSTGCSKQRGHTQFAVLMDKKELKEIQNKFLVMEELGQNKAVVKFLSTDVQENNIVKAFQHCGDILKVEIWSSEEDFYRSATIYFKTREGLRNALEETDIMVTNRNVTVEAAASVEDKSYRTSIPSLIGDPDVPAGLVKNPTRTVKITQLTCDISSDDVIAALTSCGSKVTGFFLGALDSVAFVEFETEDGKEIALAKHSLDVLGKRLQISRIDAPRTTVVRVLYNQSVKGSKIIQVCNSLGKTRFVRMRSPGIMDIHFKLAEWPNMLKILNRLNAVAIGGQTLLAQPASVFPPDILQILWSHPEERKHVKTLVQKLLQELGENVVHKVGLTDLADFY